MILTVALFPFVYTNCGGSPFFVASIHFFQAFRPMGDHGFDFRTHFFLATAMPSGVLQTLKPIFPPF
jgi:hypothetical protein